MNIKFDLLLEQVKSVEGLLLAGRVDDAKGALQGLHRILLSTDTEPSNPVSPPKAPDFTKLCKTLETVHASERAKKKKVTSFIKRFDASVPAWGWHDLQTDAVGRPYRWCGGAAEAGVRLSIEPGPLSGLALGARPLIPENFSEKSVDVRVNGKPMPIRVIRRDNNCFDLIIGMTDVVGGPSVELSIFPLQRQVPAAIGKSSDKRLLSFNVFEFIELRHQ